MLWRAEADDVGEAGISCFRSVGHAHSAADGDVVADYLATLDDGNKRKVVGVNVDVIGRWDCHGDLELPGKVGFAVNRLVFLLFGGFNFFTIKPDLVVSAGRWSEVVRDVLRDLEHVGVRFAQKRIWVAHHVPVHVAARGDGIHSRVVDLLDRGLELCFDHAVELKSLTGRQLKGAIGVSRGQVIHRNPLRRSGHSTRHAHANEEGKRLLQLVSPAPGAQVAIVLQIAAVKLEQLLLILGQATGRGVGQALGKGAAEEVGVFFEGLVGREFFLVRHGDGSADAG